MMILHIYEIGEGWIFGIVCIVTKIPERMIPPPIRV